MQAHFLLEEELFFPALRALYPDREAELGMLVKDHERLRERLRELIELILASQLEIAAKSIGAGYQRAQRDVAARLIAVLNTLNEPATHTVLIEALCCGTPAVSMDCPSGPREILRGGEYGRLVPVGDANGLAHAIETALDDKAPSPPSESWRPYDLENIVNQYVNLLVGNGMP